MGLFRKKKEEAPKVLDFPPQDATKEWFYTAEARNLFERCRDELGYSHLHMQIFWSNYFERLDNFKNLKAKYENTDKDPWVLSERFSTWCALLAVSEETDEFGDVVPSACSSYDYLLNDVGYAYYLEHLTFGMTKKVSNIVLSLIGSDQVDVREDEWLYDEAIFGHNSEAEVLDQLRKVINENGYKVDVQSRIMTVSLT